MFHDHEQAGRQFAEDLTTERIDAIRSRCDRLISPRAATPIWAVGQFYESFDPVEDDQVVELLRALAPASESTNR